LFGLAVERADTVETAEDRIATRLMLADALGAAHPDRTLALLTSAFAIAEGVDDAFGMGSSALQLADFLSAGRPAEGVEWLRRARSCFASAGRAEELAQVLVRLIVDEPEPTRAEEAFSELVGLASAVQGQGPGIRGTANLRWSERLLSEGKVEAAMPYLIAAHEASVQALDGSGAIAAGLRLNAVLTRLHEAWMRFPEGSELAGRFEVDGGAELNLTVPDPNAEVMVGWDFDPRNLPFTARHFPPDGPRNGWVLWAGAEPVAYPGYLPVRTGEVIRWLPQVAPYLQLPPGWSFQIAPDYEDVWEEPELLDEDG
jgi:hypothetical protein